MNRTTIAAEFDELIKYIDTMTEESPVSLHDRISVVRKALEILRSDSIVACVPSRNNSFENAREANDEIARWESRKYTHDFLEKSLRNYSPNRVSEKKATLLIFAIVKKMLDINADADTFCEIIALQYCQLVGIDPCTPDAFYMEEIIRSAFGLFPEIPPTIDEVEDSILNFECIISSLRNTPGIGAQKSDERRVA